jgi:hypothetical protein
MKDVALLFKLFSSYPVLVHMIFNIFWKHYRHIPEYRIMTNELRIEI